jgi:hypothetical protein
MVLQRLLALQGVEEVGQRRALGLFRWRAVFVWGALPPFAVLLVV